MATTKITTNSLAAGAALGNLNSAPINFTQSVTIGAITNINATTTITASASNSIPLIVKAAPSQTTNLLEIRNSANTPILSFNATGGASFGQGLGLASALNISGTPSPNINLTSNTTNSTNAGTITFNTIGNAETCTITFDASANQFLFKYGANTRMTIDDIGTTFNGPVTAPIINGNTTFSNNIIGNGTDNTLPNQTAAGSSSILTLALAEELYGWDTVGLASVSLNSGSGTSTGSPLGLSFDTGAVAGTNVATNKVTGPFNRSPFPLTGGNSQSFPYSSKRSRVKLNFTIVNLIGDARFVVAIATLAAATAGLPSVRSTGFWMDETNIAAFNHNGTIMSEASPVPHGLALTPVQSYDFEIEYFAGTVTLKINNVIVSSVGGGQSSLDYPDQLYIYGYTLLGDTNKCRVETKNIRSRFTTS